MFAEVLLVRYVARDELREACARSTDWLHPRERDALRRYRDSEAREAWLGGRIVAKRLAVDALRQGSRASDESPLRDVEIRSRDRAGRPVRPEIRIAGGVVPWCLSISHSARGVLAALSLDPRVRAGVDLTPVEVRSPGFLRLWFTDREQQRLRSLGPRETARYWAAKEAVYKAVNDGERFAPRQIDIVPADEAGFRLTGCPKKGSDPQPLGDAERPPCNEKGSDPFFGQPLSCRVPRRGRTAGCLIETSAYGSEIGAIAVWRLARPALSHVTGSQKIRQ
jgi:phosphopantetheinyl transferase